MAGSFTWDWCGHPIENYTALNCLRWFGLSDDRDLHFHRHGDGYDCMELAADALEAQCGKQPPASREARRDARALAPSDAWHELERDVKKGRILTALADDALIRREIIQRINNTYGLRLYDNYIDPLLKEMVAGGELERQKEPKTPNTTVSAKGGYRWRWHRATSLSPELQDLERRLKAS